MSDDPFHVDFRPSHSPALSDATGILELNDPALLDQYHPSPPSSPSSFGATDPLGGTFDSDPELVDGEPGRGRSPSSLSRYDLSESSHYYGVNRDSNPAPSSPSAPSAAPESLPQLSYFKSTPVKATLSAVNPHAIDPLEGKARGPFLIDETGMAPRWHLLAEEKFIDDIPGTLPTNDQRSRFAAFDNLDDVKKEWDIYPKLSEIGNSVFQEAGCTGLRLLITANHKDNTGTKRKSDTFNDGGIYETTKLVNDATTVKLTANERKVTNPLALKLLDSGNYGRTSFHHVAVPLEVKYNYGNSAFKFPFPSKRKAASTAQSHTDDADVGDSVVEGGDVSVEDEAAVSGAPAQNEGAAFHTTYVPQYMHDTLLGSAGISQLGEYMFKTFKYQHRIFSFAIYVCLNMCRLLRFDHSGAFVSEPFQWTSRDSALHTFLWKIASMQDSDRLAGLGYDPTASLVDETERATFAALASAPTLPQEVRTYVEEATVNNAPVYKVQVTTSSPTDDERLPDEPASPSSKDGPRTEPDTTGHQTFEFLIGDPLFAAEALVGRCTKGYVAYRLDLPANTPDKDRLCFLKDCWRPYVSGRTRPEHLVYQRLQSHSVNHIASLICGGDVGGAHAQRTTVHEFLFDTRPVPRIHYRLVTEEIGIPVTKFRDFRELARIFADALEGHSQAWTRAHVLHRDISLGNILINAATREGFLNDWDLSRFESELGNGPVEPDRSGTWQYRSALLLQYPRKPHRLYDDMESFVHAFRQLVVRFRETDQTETLVEYVQFCYEQANRRGDVLIGGSLKLKEFQQPASPITLKDDSIGYLRDALDALASSCYSFYDCVDFARMQATYGVDKHGHIEDNRASKSPATSIDDKRAAWRSRLPATAVFSEGSSRHTSTAGDPCELNGFLCSHAELLTIFKVIEAIEEPESIRKGRDYFLHQRTTHLVGSSRSSQLGSLSMTGTLSRGARVLSHSISSESRIATGSPLSLNRRLESPHLPTPSSGDSVSSRPHSRTRKRTRQDEMEDASNSTVHQPIGEAAASASRSKSRRGRKQAKQD
ncbi:hypothetical protein C8Q80DRAFT_1358826 [Daedaleopsis nitida]|nr:hypothetical protein C8Q80DRAFT_1358826 [Daedaleopsis nitida]